MGTFVALGFIILLKAESFSGASELPQRNTSDCHQREGQTVAYYPLPITLRGLKHG